MAAAVTIKGSTKLAKVSITISGFTGVTAVTVEQIRPDNTTFVIRSGGNVLLTNGGTTVPVEDYEVLLDQPFAYRVTQKTPTGSMTAQSAAITIMSYGKTFLKDPAIPARNVRLDQVESLLSNTRTARAGVFDVIDRARPIAVATARQSWTGDLALWTYTDAERIDMEKLIARGAVLLLSTPPSYGIGNEYVHVGDIACDRLPTVASEQTRHWTLPLTAVDRPATLPTMPLGTRWIDVKYRWATWGDLAATNMTWEQLLDYTPP